MVFSIKACSTPFLYSTCITVRHFSVQENVEEMKAMFSGVGISQQTSLQCFTVEVSNKVLRYVSDTLFQHYNLYEYLFSEEQGEKELSEEV